MTSYVTPRKNVAHKLYVGLVDQSNTKLLKANPTIASGDFKVSTDGGAFGNLATLPSANPASGRAIMIDLSSGEMNGDHVVVQCVDAAGAEWCDLLIDIPTSARQIDDLAFPATSGASLAVDGSGRIDLGKWIGTAPLALSSQLVQSLATLVNTQDIKKNTALTNFMFVMYDIGGTPKTGLQASLRTAGNAQGRIDGGSFADLTNIATITEIANGWYTLDFAAADLNGTNIAIRLAATGARDLDFLIHTVSP